MTEAAGSREERTPTPRALAHGDWLVRHRFGIQAGLDGVAWVLAVALSTGLRYDFEADLIDPGGLALVCLATAAIHIVIGTATGLYNGRFRFGSFDEITGLVRAVLLTTVIGLVVDLGSGQPRLVPLSALIAGGFIALVITSGVRYAWRLLLEARLRPDGAIPAIVFGAGDGGLQVTLQLLRNPASRYRPVALLDDNPAKRNLTISGVRVAGTRDDLAATAKEHDAEAVVIAIASAGSKLISEISELARQAGLRVLVLPPLRELFDGDVAIEDVRPLAPADLLGRHEIDTNLTAVAGLVTGRRVLVTGAGGSIGAELCRQLAGFAPATLVMLDHDESGLHAVQLDLEGRALLDDPSLVVADLRDEQAVRDAVAEHRPEVVFHAAALKHLTLLERFPREAVLTNVLGTRTLLDACLEHAVEHVVNISTDKAADPTSVLGRTKAIAERLTAEAAQTSGRTFVSVRFGNVLGSRGSVLTAFQAQIAAGGPLTVTDPAVTRYFMTVEEAVQLVVQAAAIGKPGEVLILDVGEPVRIAHVAELLAAQASRPIGIVYTGLRPGEKLHERLWGVDERPRAGPHPMITHIEVPGLGREELDHLLELDEEDLRRQLVQLNS